MKMTEQISRLLPPGKRGGLPWYYRLARKIGFIRPVAERIGPSVIVADRYWFGWGGMVVGGIPGGGINLEIEMTQLAVLKNQKASDSAKGTILQGIIDGRITFQHATEDTVRGAIEPLTTHQSLGNLAKSALEKLYPTEKQELYPTTAGEEPATSQPAEPPVETSPQRIEVIPPAGSAALPHSIETAPPEILFNISLPRELNPENLRESAEAAAGRVKKIRKDLHDQETSLTWIEGTMLSLESQIAIRRKQLEEIEAQLTAIKKEVEEKYSQQLSEIRETARQKIEKVKQEFPDTEGDETFNLRQRRIREQLITQIENDMKKEIEEISAEIEREVRNDPRTSLLMVKQRALMEDLRGSPEIQGLEESKEDLERTGAEIEHKITRLNEDLTKALQELEEVGSQARTVAEQLRKLLAEFEKISKIVSETVEDKTQNG